MPRRRWKTAFSLTLAAVALAAAWVWAGSGEPLAKEEIVHLTVPGTNIPVCGTYSIVALDPETGELGVAVQSRIVGVGAIVPWAKAGVGAVASQAYANPRYGPVGMLMLETGATAEQTVAMLTRADPQAAQRQVGIIAATGEPATYTGTDCGAFAGGLTGKNYAVLGNILTSEDVLKAMAKTFEETKGTLADRLIAALEAAQAAGGDKRGMQSAALLVVREGWGYAGLNDRFRDIRVDEHPEPIAELKRVYEEHRKLFPRPDAPEPEPAPEPAPEAPKKSADTPADKTANSKGTEKEAPMAEKPPAADPKTASAKDTGKSPKGALD